MTPVTARRGGPRRVDGRRRQSTGRGVAQLPTLFDAAPGGATLRDDGARGGATVEVDGVRCGATVEVDGVRCGATVEVDAGHRPAAPQSAGHGETLDRLVVSCWERLVSHADAPCLLCGGTMQPRYGAHAASIGGRCRDCGTTLG